MAAALLCFNLAAGAQTALIAHRSHSGSASTFAPAPDNFGQLPFDPRKEGVITLTKGSAADEGEKLTVTKVVRQADGTVIRYGISDAQGAVVDTFAAGFHFNYPAFTARQAREFFGPGAELVGFDRKPKAAGRPPEKPARLLQTRSAADTARPATPVPARRRGRALPPGSGLPDHPGPTLLLVLTSLAVVVVLWQWRSYRAAPRPRVT